MTKSRKENRKDKGSKYWDRVANRYGIFTIQGEKEYDQLRKLIEAQLTGSERVLEVGSGVGAIIGPLASSMKTGLGIDLSCKMVEKARKTYKAKNLDFRCEDAGDIQEEDDSFDLVIASNILHIVPHPEKVLKECFRVLKTRGLLIAPNFIVGDSIKAKLQLRILKLLGLEIYKQWDYGEYQQFLSSNGFCVLKTDMLDSEIDIAYVICTPEKGMESSPQFDD